jgi:hypothetical protein
MAAYVCIRVRFANLPCLTGEMDEVGNGVGRGNASSGDIVR